MRSTDQDARPRRGEAVKPASPDAHPERAEHHAQGEAQGAIGEARLCPRLTPKPRDPLARCRRDQGISAVRAVRPYLSFAHMLKPYTLPPPTTEARRAPHSPLPYRGAAPMAAQ